MNDTDGPRPTVIYEGRAELPPTVVAEGSRAAVGFTAGATPRFSDETAALVRARLKAASLILAVTLAIAFVRNLFVPEQFMIVLRGALLAITIAAYVVLGNRMALSLRQLRLIEWVVFGGLVVQIGAMAWLALNQFADADDFATVVGVKNLYLAAFAVLILLYGMLMPNTWQRAAAILLPAACIPYAILYASQWRSEQVAQALEADHFGAPVPLPLIAAFAAVYGTHIINAIRREAFKARQLGQYRLKDKLGSGGMGEVYRAEHMLLKRPCAIKFIKEEQGTDKRALARFEREVRSTARLTHWNSVEIFDYGHTEDGVFYYVMEYLPGKSLDELVKEHGPLPAERVVHFLRQTCRALREAHHLGLVHRDLKPANIFAAKVGGMYDVAKLLDFGLVKQTHADPQQAATLTQGVGFGGSPLYMPPEQATAYDDVDGRGDIYSLGAVAYFLLTGKPPFKGRSAIEIIMAHASEPVLPPSKIVPTIPADLERIVLRCLEKNRQDRYSDVQSLEHALAGCACADHWTEADAARWWSGIGETLDDA